MKVVALIPARLESSRFPNKLIKKIDGIPIIVRTYNAAIESNLFNEVYVVSGNEEIIELINSVNGLTIKSKKEHLSGTDRISEASNEIECDIIVNLQGDEPFIDKESIRNLISSFDDPNVKIASLMTNFTDFDEINNPNNVKVVVNKNSDAIFFSRLPIPHGSSNILDYKRHIGLYAFRYSSLDKFSKLERSKNEIIENLEGNRAIDNAISIKMVFTDHNGISIDTIEDFENAKKIITKND